MDILLLLLLIVLNGVFAMSELALVAARPARLAPLAARGDRPAIATLQLKQTPTRFLSTVQIGITSISILNGIIGEAALAGPLSHWLETLGMERALAQPGATLIVVVGITFASIVLGELVPKRIAQVAPEDIARLIALPMRLLARVAAPFVWLLSATTEGVLRLMRMRDRAGPPITEEEIHAMLVEGTHAGVIEASEHDMVRRVLRLDDRRVSTFMTPRREMISLETGDDLRTNLRRAALSARSRFPVRDTDTGEMIGIVHTRQLLQLALEPDQADWHRHIGKPLFVPESLTGRELLDTFRQTRAGAALVVDEYGDLQGLVTVTDLLDAIGGHVAQPSRERLAKTDTDGTLRIDARLDALDLRDMLALDEMPGGEPPPYDTAGGMLQFLLGRLARTGDRVPWEAWQFEVIESDGRAARTLIARRIADGQAPADPDSVPGPT
ncbi:MAG: hemolysin family protein [Burkholderiaceae bacterium]